MVQIGWQLRRKTEGMKQDNILDKNNAMQVLDYNWSNKTVLVTGASGFKGSWLSEVLLRLGAIVYGTVRNRNNPISAYHILDLDRRIVKVDVDISDRQQVYDMVNSVSPDVIFHLAAKAIVPVANRDPRRTFDVNIMGTINIMEACRKLKIVDKLIICSTDHVFGNASENDIPPNGFLESDRVSYGGPYDTSKAAMELVVRSYHFTYWDELPSITITRCANVFGYGDVAQRRVIPFFVDSAINNGKIELKFRRNGRQFIHVSDTIAGYIRAASKSEEGAIKDKKKQAKPISRSPFTPTYHFAIEQYDGTNSPFIRIKDLSEQIAYTFGNTSIVETSGCLDYAPEENRIQALNCALTKERLNWIPLKPFIEAIEELGEWYKKENQNKEILFNLINEKIDALIMSLTR